VLIKIVYFVWKKYSTLKLYQTYKCKFIIFRTPIGRVNEIKTETKKWLFIEKSAFYA